MSIKKNPLWLLVSLALTIFSMATAIATATAPVLVWPTPNPAFSNGATIEGFVQAAASGNPRSGLYGCVRNGGTKFHEGLDLFGLEFDENNEVKDSVFSVFSGRVALINKIPAYSDYGRYVVIAHQQEGVSFYTLYAHLKSVDSRLILNSEIKGGSRIGRMGRSAGSYTIPKQRAHLHFEIGLKLSRNFQNWYNRKSFESPNWHGQWNGMNLLGVDPLDFFRSIQSRKVSSFPEYLKSLPVLVKVQVRYSQIPSFVRENRFCLVKKRLNKDQIAGWSISFSKYGIPVRWEPLSASEMKVGTKQNIQIISYNSSLNIEPCCALFQIKDQSIKPSKLLLSHLEKLLAD